MQKRRVALPMPYIVRFSFESRGTDEPLQDLESLLKSSCDVFIHAAAQLLVGRVVGALGPASATATAAPLAWGPWSTHVVAQLEAMVQALPDILLVLRRRIALYMESGVTAGILFQPVRDSCSQALSAVRRRSGELAAAAAVSSSDMDRGSNAAALGRIERLCDDALHLLQRSDALVDDAAGPGFGYDDHVLSHPSPQPAVTGTV